MIDSHVHTHRCHHAQGRMEAYVASAVAAGLTSVCFLEHFTPADVHHTASMALDEIPAYLQEGLELRDRFRGRIEVKVGLEIDYQPQHIDLYHQVVADFPFDAIGSSIHTIDGVDVVSSGTVWHNGELDRTAIVGLYWERMAQMVAADYFDFVCHLDLIKKFDCRASSGWDDQIDDVLKTVQQRGLAVELNTSGLTHPVAEAYPSDAILKRCRQLGIDMTLSSDAHHPDQVGRFFDQGLRHMKTAGFDQIVTFDRRRLKRIAI